MLWIMNNIKYRLALHLSHCYLDYRNLYTLIVDGDDYFSDIQRSVLHMNDSIDNMLTKHFDKTDEWY